MSFSSNARDLVVYDMNSRGNPGSVVTEKWLQKLEQKGFNVIYKAGVGCHGRDQFAGEPRASLGILFAGRMWGSLDRGEDQCVVDLGKVVAVSSYQYTIELCTRLDSGLQAQDLFRSTALKIGSNGKNNPHGYWVRSFNAQYNTNHVAVETYTNSRAVSLGILSGDIHFGLISSLDSKSLLQTGKIKCVATTDPSKNNQFASMFPKIPGLINSFNGTYGILARNLSPQDLATINQVITDTGKDMQSQGYDGLQVSTRTLDENDRYIRQIIIELANTTKKMQ